MWIIFKEQNLNLKVLLSICLIFCHFQPGLLYKSFAYKKACIWKSMELDGTKPFNTKHYTPDISLLTKNVLSFDVALLHPPGMDCSPFQWTFMGNSVGDGESYLTIKTFFISPSKKKPLNRFTSSTIKRVIPSLSNNNFHVINLCKLHL